MALTITPRRSTVFGDCRIVFADIAWDNSYRTGGLSLKSTDFGTSDALKIRFLDSGSASGLTFEYDYTNSKLKSIYPTGGASAPAATAAPRAAAASGATAVTSSAATVPVTLTAGTSLEVAASTDLSAVTVRVMAVLSA